MSAVKESSTEHALSEQIAREFILHAIQEWGDSPERRIAAVQAVIDAAGFQAKATCWPIFGGIWPQPCEGERADEASAWLNNLTSTIPRGHFEDEVEHVATAIARAEGETG